LLRFSQHPLRLIAAKIRLHLVDGRFQRVLRFRERSNFVFGVVECRSGFARCAL
jgi:hypothetical protein